MRLPKPSLCLLVALLFTVTPTRAQDHKYTSIVVFGDSLSDTGNDADLTEAKYQIRVPGIDVDYANGRFTDGHHTTPAAQKYFGVWIQQFAKMLPDKPEVRASLNHGTNYAYGFATTGEGVGDFTFGPSDSYSVYIDNVGLQISDYLATHPKIDDKTLFVVWGGAIDVLYATSPADIVQAGIQETENVQRLVDAGATQIIVPNLPPLGDVPRLNGSTATSTAANEASILYNDTLSAGLDLVRFDVWRPVRLYRLDVFSLFESVLAAPSAYGLSNVTGSSQGVATVNPDTFLFWDDLHPTTHGHHLLALKALKLADPAECDARARRGEERCDAFPVGAGSHN
jgi:phospholipase/lecithinase/hemolysin